MKLMVRFVGSSVSFWNAGICNLAAVSRFQNDAYWGPAILLVLLMVFFVLLGVWFFPKQEAATR